MHTQRVLPSPVHRQRFGGLAGQVGVVAVPVRLETDVLPRRICTPSSASLDGHSQLGHEEHAVDGSAPDSTGLPVLTLIEQKALLVGLSDGLQRRSIRHPEPRGVLRALLRLVFGHRGVPPLADPKLEALRALAMDHVRGRSCPGITIRCQGLPPELVAAARHLLAH